MVSRSVINVHSNPLSPLVVNSEYCGGIGRTGNTSREIERLAREHESPTAEHSASFTQRF